MFFEIGSGDIYVLLLALDIEQSEYFPEIIMLTGETFMNRASIIDTLDHLFYDLLIKFFKYFKIVSMDI